MSVRGAHIHQEGVRLATFYLIFSSPEPLGSQGELIGWP